MKHLLAAATTVVAVVIALGVFAGSGVYDVGADAPHGPLVARVLGWARDRSIDVRARDIVVPDLADPQWVATGAEHYAAMCVGCHLSPEVAQTEMRQGLYPVPPDLTEPPPGDPARQFWVIKHGIKASGMPAWGTSHRDEAIWSLVAFLQRLPALSPQQYADLTEPDAPVTGREQAPAHRHEHGHGTHRHD